MRRVFLGLLLLAITTASLLADETIRQTQEELRKRNLYFGDINGQTSPELESALRRYQRRKGFDVTGTVNNETASSLHIQGPVAPSTTSEAWPDLPVLKSDTARELPVSERVTLEKRAQIDPEFSPSPAPPAESPSASQDLTPAKVKSLVESYLRDAETQNVAAQVKYYTYPIQYFDHGVVDKHFVEKDTRNYVNRWPDRKYTLVEPVNFYASAKEGETNVEFPIAFKVRNKHHSASGRTKNFWTIRSEGDDLKIVAIREQRLRE